MHQPDSDESQVMTRRRLLRSGFLLSSGLVLAACTDKVLPPASSTPSGQAGTGSSPAVAGVQAQTCTASPQVTEGPYFVDERLERSDIRMDPVTGEMSPGVPLRLG